jgi:hypothetical protein
VPLSKNLMLLILTSDKDFTADFLIVQLIKTSIALFGLNAARS